MSVPRRDPFSILNKESDKWLLPEPQQKKRTTQRYIAGQAPQWEIDEDDIFTEESDRKTMISLGNTSITSEKLKTKFYQQQEQQLEGIQEQKVIRRPRRVVMETEIVEENEEEKKDNETKIEEEFQVPKAKEITKKQQTQIEVKFYNLLLIIKEIDLNSEVLSRRARIKQRLQQESNSSELPAQIEQSTDRNNIHQRALLQSTENQQQQQQQQQQQYENNEDSDDQSSEQEDSLNNDAQSSESEENDSKKDYLEEQEQREQISLMKPVFVSREVRETREQYIEDEIKLEEEKKATEQRKKQETKMFVIEAIRNKNKDEDDENTDGEEMPDDDDNSNEKLEYESWKVRELKRIHREREESQKYEKQQKEILRRRNLTDEQRIIENIKLGSDQTELKKLKEGKTKYRFMQKFYKLGAFYLDSDDPLFKRDYNIAVGEDLRDKSSLPQYLQKRRGQIGMRGQTKYTHLTDQDTNNFDPFFKIDEGLFEKQLNKTAGYKGTNIMDRSNLKKVKL